MNSTVKIGTKIVNIDNFKKEYVGTCRKQDLDVIRDFKSVVKNMRNIRSTEEYVAYSAKDTIRPIFIRSKNKLGRKLDEFGEVCNVIKRVTKDKGYAFHSQFPIEGTGLDQDIDKALAIIKKMEKGLDLEKASGIAERNQENDLELTSDFLNKAENTDFSNYVEEVPRWVLPDVDDIVHKVVFPSQLERFNVISDEEIERISETQNIWGRGCAHHMAAEMVGLAENGKIMDEGNVIELSQEQRDKILEYAARAIKIRLEREGRANEMQDAQESLGNRLEDIGLGNSAEKTVEGKTITK